MLSRAIWARGGWGGGVLPYVCILGYVPRERPPFSVLNFRSGAYHFHILQKNPFRRHHHFTFFAVPEPMTIIFKISLISSPFHHDLIASHGRLSPRTQSVRQRRGLAAVLEIRIFHAQKTAQVRSGSPRIFKLKTAQARSGAPHFHARPGARSGALAQF